MAKGKSTAASATPTKSGNKAAYVCAAHWLHSILGNFFIVTEDWETMKKITDGIPTPKEVGTNVVGLAEHTIQCAMDTVTAYSWDTKVHGKTATPEMIKFLSKEEINHMDALIASYKAAHEKDKEDTSDRAARKRIRASMQAEPAKEMGKDEEMPQMDETQNEGGASTDVADDDDSSMRKELAADADSGMLAEPQIKPTPTIGWGDIDEQTAKAEDSDGDCELGVGAKVTDIQALQRRTTELEKQLFVVMRENKRLDAQLHEVRTKLFCIYSVWLKNIAKPDTETNATLLAKVKAIFVDVGLGDVNKDMVRVDRNGSKGMSHVRIRFRYAEAAEYVLNNRRLLCIKHWQHVKTDKGKAIAGLMADMSIKVKRANTQASNNGYFQVERWAIRDAPQTVTNTTEERQQKMPKSW